MLSAFVATLVVFGPRARHVLAARLSSANKNSPPVALDRVGFLDLPAWLPKSALLAVARDLQPQLCGSVPILDDEAGRLLQRRLETVSWVQKARLQRVFPDRLRLQLDLRRPVLRVLASDGELLCLCDRDGVALPAVEFADLPCTQLSPATGPGSFAAKPGERIADDRVLAAAAVAVEWRDELAPLVDGCPRLLEVDAMNLRERYVQHPHYPEIRVLLARSDGGTAVFAYGHPPDAEAQRVPVADKAKVLRLVLAEHPGLAGLRGGDLRFTVRWQDWLDPRTGPDPAGPWNPR